MIAEETPQIFISYASPDRGRVLPFYDALEKDGLNVWMDCRKLMAGQNWDFELKRSLDKSSLVLVFLSNNSVNRRGYLQREIKIALDKMSEKLFDDIYIVPVVLDDDIELPEQLKPLHAVFARDGDCLLQVRNSLAFQLERLGVEIQQAQSREEIYWTLNTRKESWDGLPGYEVEFQVIELSSDRYLGMADVSGLISGWLLGELLSSREVKFEQAQDYYNYGQERFLRTNSFDAHTAGPSIKGKMMSIVYAIHTYGAGAAHPNTHFRTYSFVLDPLVQVESLEHIFSNKESALQTLKEYVRTELKSLKYDEAGDGELLLDAAWVDRGTESWLDFSSFS
ncbi:MAG: toll/interleukin-1 receptor domain-containing protein, partial [Moraxellaceae bacterium]|nr:toll/interleukin-1 receptor domain-containing protein [Moraxellaceae bacterium]